MMAAVALALLLALSTASAQAAGDMGCPDSASRLPSDSQGLVFTPTSFLLHPHCVALNGAANPQLGGVASVATPYTDAEHGALPLSSYGWD